MDYLSFIVVVFCLLFVPPALTAAMIDVVFYERLIAQRASNGYTVAFWRRRLPWWLCFAVWMLTIVALLSGSDGLLPNPH